MAVLIGETSGRDKEDEERSLIDCQSLVCLSKYNFLASFLKFQIITSSHFILLYATTQIGATEAEKKLKKKNMNTIKASVICTIGPLKRGSKNRLDFPLMA